MDPTEQGRRAALAGRPVFANPHIGGEAESWFKGYRSVPEAEHGSRPDLKPLPSARKLARHPRGRAIGRDTGMSDAGVNALGNRRLPGSRTPRPWAVDGVGQ